MSTTSCRLRLPGHSALGQPRLRRRRRPGPDAGRLLGLRARPPDPRGRGLARPRHEGLRRPAPVRGLSPHAALELRHRHRPEPVPVAVPRRHQDRRLPDGAAAQGAASPARQPVHRRRRRPRQDDRGRPDRPRAAPAQEGEDHRRRRAALRARAVEGRAGGALRPGVRDPRPGAT